MILTADDVSVDRQKRETYLIKSWKYTVITMYLLALWVSATKNRTFVTFDDGFLTVIRDHAQWSLTRNQKQNDAYFWP